MSCVIKYKGTEYKEEDYKNVAIPIYNFINKKLNTAGAELKDSKKSIFTIKDKDGNWVKASNTVNYINSLFTKYSGGQKILHEAKGLNSFKERTTFWELDLNPILDTFIEAYNRKKVEGVSLPFKENPELLFRLAGQIAEKTNPDTALDTLLTNFLKENGIKVEVIESIKDRLGVDVEGAYDTVNKLILLAKDKITGDTLPEEVGHVIIETLGKEHPLVKLLISSIKKDKAWKDLIDPKYIELYKNDEDALAREAAGQLIGKSLTKNFKSKEQRESIIQKIIKRFKTIFNLNNGKFIKDYNKIADKLATSVLKGSFNNDFKSLSDTSPSHPIFYRISKSNKVKKQDKISNPDIEKEKEVFLLQKRYLNKLIDKARKTTDPKIKKYLEKKIETYKTYISQYNVTVKRKDLISLSKYTLSIIDELLTNYEDKSILLNELSSDDIVFMSQALAAFKAQPSLSEMASEYNIRLKPIIEDFILKKIKEFREDKQDFTYNDVMRIEEDINGFSKNLGTLSDVESVLGSTIGLLIKQAQNRITRNNEKVAKEIKEETSKLKEVQASRGVSEANMFDIFITESDKTTHLTGPFNSEYYKDRAEMVTALKSGDPELISLAQRWFKSNKSNKEEDIKPKYKNENYFIIQNNPGLKRFYDFYSKKMDEAFAKLPIDPRKNFIANIKENTLLDAIKHKGILKGFGNAIEDFLQIAEIDDSVSINENLLPDDLPILYTKPLNAKEKSKQLDNSLNIFLRAVNNHAEMSSVLPQIRILEEQINKKEFSVKGSSMPISGSDSKLSSMIKSVVDMQVKGKMKKKEGTITRTFYDENGKEVSKVIHLSTIGDELIGYNSLLRIGLNPMNAISNVIIGDIANTMESVGGQFFGTKDLSKASGIFFSQTFTKDSKLNKIVELLNPLQELGDWEAKEETNKKFSKEKLHNWMFSLQKKGELYLQIRPMIASMLSDKIEDKDGNLVSLWEAFDENGNWKEDKFGKLTEDKLDKMSNRIQRINQIIHGRYSSRDASLASQYFFGRAALQFRKWIPTAIESRFTNYRYDPRLGEYIEGRWRTGGRLFGELFSNNPSKRSLLDMIGSLIKDKDKLVSGKDLTKMERANIRKNVFELMLIVGTVSLTMLILGGDDDDDKITNSAAKIFADQLNRISGDLLYFMNPREYVSMGRNILPVAKTMNDLINTSLNIGSIFGGEDSEYRSGYRKGENKFWSNVGSSIPIIKSGADFIRYFNDEAYIQPQRK